MTTTTTAPAAFWNNRYQIRKVPYGKSGLIYHIVDSANPREPTVSSASLRRDAQAEADKLNADPSANYNGMDWPKVHYANVYDPEELCDCRDPAKPWPRPCAWRAPNVCGGVVGTFCKTHGRHDDCPRSVRGVNLSTDPLYLAQSESALERHREELARSEAFIEREGERVERLQRLARRYAA